MWAHRRKFLKLFSLNIGLLFSNLAIAPGLRKFLPPSFNKSSGFSALSFSQMILMTAAKDKVDSEGAYYAQATFKNWHQQVHALLNDLKRDHLVPQNGAIVELGTYKGKTSAVMKTLFGKNRYVGYDIAPWNNDPCVIIKDVRHLDASDDQPIALGFSDTSNWSGSPRSRKAASDFIRKNLVPGGIYIEEGLSMLPSDFDMTNLKILRSEKYYTVFTRV